MYGVIIYWIFVHMFKNLVMFVYYSFKFIIENTKNVESNKYKAFGIAKILGYTGSSIYKWWVSVSLWYFWKWQRGSNPGRIIFMGGCKDDYSQRRVQCCVCAHAFGTKDTNKWSKWRSKVWTRIISCVIIITIFRYYNLQLMTRLYTSEKFGVQQSKTCHNLRY